MAAAASLSMEADLTCADTAAWVAIVAFTVGYNNLTSSVPGENRKQKDESKHRSPFLLRGNPRHFPLRPPCLFERFPSPPRRKRRCGDFLPPAGKKLLPIR